MLSTIFFKGSTKEYCINLLNCVSLPGYMYHCALKYTYSKLQTLQDKDLILLIENNRRGGISSVMGDRLMNKLEEILNSPYDSDMRHFNEVDLKYPDFIKEKTKKNPFCPGKK